MVLEKIIPGVVGGLLTALVLWLFGVFAAEGNKLVLPKHAVSAFNLQSCPSPGWKEYTQSRGRYIVGLQPNGKLGKTVGSELSDSENRPAGRHTHKYKDSQMAGNGSVLRGGGAGLARPDPERETLPDESVSEGTNAPYVQLIICERV